MHSQQRERSKNQRIYAVALTGALLTTSIAYAQPAACRAPNINAEFAKKHCVGIMTPLTPPPIPLVCKNDATRAKLTEQQIRELCTPAPLTPEHEEGQIWDPEIIDPRCSGDAYLQLPPETRKTTCIAKHVSDFDPFCRDYLTGQIALSDEQAQHYCPNMPRVLSAGARLMLIDRYSLGNQLQQKYDEGYEQGKSSHQ